MEGGKEQEREGRAAAERLHTLRYTCAERTDRVRPQRHHDRLQVRFLLRGEEEREGRKQEGESGREGDDGIEGRNRRHSDRVQVV